MFYYTISLATKRTENNVLRLFGSIEATDVTIYNFNDDSMFRSCFRPSSRIVVGYSAKITISLLGSLTIYGRVSALSHHDKKPYRSCTLFVNLSKLRQRYFLFSVLLLFRRLSTIITRPNSTRSSFTTISDRDSKYGRNVESRKSMFLG